MICSSSVNLVAFRRFVSENPDLIKYCEEHDVPLSVRRTYFDVFVWSTQRRLQHYFDEKHDDRGGVV